MFFVKLDINDKYITKFKYKYIYILYICTYDDMIMSFHSKKRTNKKYSTLFYRTILFVLFVDILIYTSYMVRTSLVF